MKKTLSRYGNSRALIIDKPILELLGIEDDTVLNITTDGKILIIEPIKEKSNKKEKLINHPAIQKIKDEKIRKIVAEVMERHAEALKELADK